MFEFEVDHAPPAPDLLPDEVKALFKDYEADIRAVALLPWEEHCTECAMPQCYRSCDLYVPRKDGHCRRFVEGITPVPEAPNLQDYVVRIAFKRWGELLASGSARLVPVRRAERAERLCLKADRLAAAIPDRSLAIAGRRGISSRLERRLKRSLTSGGLLVKDRQHAPDYFLVEVFNPNAFGVKLSVSIMNPDVRPAFQELLEVPPGFHRFKLDYARIREFVPHRDRVNVSINPNLLEPGDEGLVLYFGLLTFVADRQYRADPAARGGVRVPRATLADGQKFVKVLAWDLDQTLWEGILLEDGAERLRLRPGIAGIIRELDRRGIMNTVISKNNPDEALALLEAWGLAEYLVFPKIGWQPKGEFARQLVREFNVGEDTVALIDDSPFEREQVRAMNPRLRTYPAEEYGALLERPEFCPPVTEEASQRRSFYRNQELRDEARASFGGQYEEFLRSCAIRLEIDRAAPERADRIHELVQRTNQLNFSGTRYGKEGLAELLRDPSRECYSMACRDRFGSYGTVGFAVVEKSVPRLVDLMFSCRIQAKRVEHAFLLFLLALWRQRGAERLEARYVQTERNRQAGQVFDDLGFRPLEPAGPGLRFDYPLGAAVPAQDLVEVWWEGARWAP